MSLWLFFSSVLPLHPFEGNKLLPVKWNKTNLMSRKEKERKKKKRLEESRLHEAARHFYLSTVTQQPLIV